MSKGFSTAATEELIVGTPVCATQVSGMDELLGDNEFGLITENDEEALYAGIKQLLDDPKLLERYRQQAKRRRTDFSTEYIASPFLILGSSHICVCRCGCYQTKGGAKTVLGFGMIVSQVHQIP